MNRYADLHLHPAHSDYNKVRYSREEKDEWKNHHWNIPRSNLIKQKEGKQAFRYNQADFAKCQVAGIRLAFASLYPIERGFFIGHGGRVVYPMTQIGRYPHNLKLLFMLLPVLVGIGAKI